MRELTAYLILLISVMIPLTNVLCQGANHNWLVGYDVALFDTNVTATKAIMDYDSNSLSVIPQSRKMAFRATQGNISNESGNLIIASNGCWIANATGDTMLNGSGLNTTNMNSWCTNITGIPIPHGALILPLPGDSMKFVHLHQNMTTLFYSIIDMALDGGLGGVIQKNVVVVSDSLSLGFSACKHANGRDWWVVALKDKSNLIYKVLVTPDTVTSITTEILNMPITPIINAGQPQFSPDGSKFAYMFGYGGPNGRHDVRVFNFDRCTGSFDSLTYINEGTTIGMGFGLTFSSNSTFLYHSSWSKIYQLNLSTLSQDTVAINDGFYSPYPPFQTDFWLMYRAANGKIYISSGNSVIDMHVINNPDSAGLACDVQQHSIHLPCFHSRGNVNHPNYYLGPVTGSVCDTLSLGLLNDDDNFNFSIFPNPNSGVFNISYLLPLNSNGILEIIDSKGQKVYSKVLSQWSTLQNIELPNNIISGIYNCMLTSKNKRVNLKFAVVKQ